MNAKTKEAIIRHGEALLTIFPTATERDPIALCKKIRRIETAVEKPILGYCNGTTSEGGLNLALTTAKKRVAALLGSQAKLREYGFFINTDPRGYALKLSDSKVRELGLSIERDWGGYGILAPDLTA